MLADSKDVKTAAMSVVIRLEFVENALTAAKEKEAALIQKVLRCQEKDSMLYAVQLYHVMLCHVMIRNIMSYQVILLNVISSYITIGHAMSCHPMS